MSCSRRLLHAVIVPASAGLLSLCRLRQGRGRRAIAGRRRRAADRRHHRSWCARSRGATPSLALGTARRASRSPSPPRSARRWSACISTAATKSRAGAPLVTLTGRQQQARSPRRRPPPTEAEQLYERQNELATQQLIARSSLDTQRAMRDAARARVRADARRPRRPRDPRAVRRRARHPPGQPGHAGARRAPRSPRSTTSRASTSTSRCRKRSSPTSRAGQQLQRRSTAYPGARVRRRGQHHRLAHRRRPRARSPCAAISPIPIARCARACCCRCSCRGRERQALVVPEIAVVQVGADTFVYRVKPDGSVEQAEVKVGSAQRRPGRSRDRA